MLLIVLCTAVLCSIAAATLARLEPPPLALTAMAAAAGAGCVWRRPGWRLLALGCGAGALGALRASLAAPPEPEAFAALEQTRVMVSGEVISTPQVTARSSRFVLAAESVNATPLHTRLQVVGDPHAAAGRVAVGDRIQAAGRLLPAEGGPLRTLYFPELTVTPSAAPHVMALAASVRADAVRGIQAYLPEPQASLAAGILLGGSGNLSPEFRLQLQRSGLAHIVAIDGYKQVIVTAVLGSVAVRFLGRRKAAVPLLLGVLAYTILTGARPSAVRAALMVGMTTVAGTLGRVSDSLTSLLLAAVAMAMHDPSVMHDVGFQLSYTATLGLIVLMPRVGRLLRGVPHWIADQTGVSCVVTLATLPVMLSVFHEISLVSPLSHVVAMPLLTPVLLGAAVLAGVSAWPPLAGAVAGVVWVPAVALSETVRISGSLPGAAITTGHLPPHAALAMAGVLLGLCIWELPELASARAGIAEALSARRRVLGPLAIAGAGVLGVSVLLLVRPDGRLTVEPLPVARGEALLVRGPTGQTALITAGRVDGRVITRLLAERLRVWEHGLHAVLTLDEESDTAVEAALERYPAQRHLDGFVDGRLDLGGGAVLDVYPHAAESALGPRAGVAVSYGQVWLRLAGRPPEPASADADVASLDGETLVSDGVSVWRRKTERASGEARPAL